MTLEELLYKRLIDDKVLVDNLAKYSGCPAIFNSIVPDDKQEGWGGKVQYPRICYTLDFQTNIERASVGMMDLAIYYESTNLKIEEIEGQTRRCLKDVLLKPDGEFPYVFTWNSTEPFKWNRGIVGIDLRFDMREYLSQETTDPDPIVALNYYLKRIYADSIVLGVDELENITKASSDAPIFYCRLEHNERERETNTVVWMNCKIAVHLICPDSTIRRKMIMAAANKLSLDGEVIMLDKSPMFIKNLQVSHEADYLTKGQMYITARYGLLRYTQKNHMLTGAFSKYS